MKLLANVLLVHLVLYLGLVGEGELVGSLASYPGHLWDFVAGSVSGAGPWVFREALLLTGSYLSLALALAWGLVPVLRILPRQLLWTLSGLPSFLLLVLGVMMAFYMGARLGVFTPIEPGQPWLIAVVTLALALPYTARGALYLKLRQDELQGADFVRTARAVGMPEARVRRRTARVALPEGARLLAGDVFAVALGTVLLEGLLWLPGLGRAVYEALAGALGPELAPLSASAASHATLLLLLLAGAYALALAALASRLEPRGR